MTFISRCEITKKCVALTLYSAPFLISLRESKGWMEKEREGQTERQKRGGGYSIYIYIYIERERERERESVCVCVGMKNGEWKRSKKRDRGEREEEEGGRDRGDICIDTQTYIPLLSPSVTPSPLLPYHSKTVCNKTIHSTHIQLSRTHLFKEHPHTHLYTV